MKMNPVGIRYW